jgi:putative transposase
MPCTTQPQAKKKISRSTQKGGAQQDLVVHPRAPSHHQTHAVVLAPSATLGSTPELIDAEADTHYQGLRFWLKEKLGWTLEIAKHWWTGVRAFWVAPGQEPPQIPTGFHVLPRRWVVERTFAWLGRNRRLAKDYEKLPGTEEAFIYMAMSRILIKRLAKSATS